MNYTHLKKYVMDIVEQEIESIIEQAGSNILDELRTILPIDQNISLDKETIIKFARQTFNERQETQGKENSHKALRFVCLKTIDMFWSEHLYTLESLKDAVRLRAYGGRDPLVEYKTESHHSFIHLQNLINSQIARTIFKIAIDK